MTEHDSSTQHLWDLTTGILNGPVVRDRTIVEEDSDSPMMAWTADWPEQFRPEVLSPPFIRAMAARIEDSVEPQLS